MVLLIDPPRHQSQDISYADWMSVLTVCFAPLLAHIFAGAPTPSFLIPTKPSWHDYITLFNPTAIIYRYGAIVERRLRAYKWEPIDFAAANALFWTERGWDGSEDMVISSLPYCTMLPKSTTLRIVSVQMMKTVITASQGMQAAISLVGPMMDTVYIMFSAQPAVDFTFGPLAMLGLLRLLPSAWLSDEFLYTAIPSGTSYPILKTSKIIEQRRVSWDSLLQDSPSDASIEIRYQPASYWPSRLFRFMYLGILVALWVLLLCWALIPDKTVARSHIMYYTATSFSIAVFYFITFTITTVTYGWYSVQGQTTSTILPCISRLWFKAYASLWLLSAALLVTLAALETYKTPCGVYTSIQPRWTGSICSQNTVKVDFDSSMAGAFKTFGLASQFDWDQREVGAPAPPGVFWVSNFTGTCLGNFHNMTQWTRAQALAMEEHANLTSILVENLDFVLE
ncbi:hypothetical protein G7054_g3020 [Neopestalotiopsis clavispora]|nr:hypothetical protein G7054_g3020 [Neopestalotiopsis clavispora]